MKSPQVVYQQAQISPGHLQARMAKDSPKSFQITPIAEILHWEGMSEFVWMNPGSDACCSAELPQHLINSIGRERSAFL